MGQQQLLLIVVGVVIVGLAVVLGFNMFQDAAESGTYDSAVALTQNIGRQAASSVMRGAELGGYADAEAWATANATMAFTGFGDAALSGAGDVITAIWTFDNGTPACTTLVNIETGAISNTPSN